jgi:hypothetical protein
MGEYIAFDSHKRYTWVDQQDDSTGEWTCHRVVLLSMRLMVLLVLAPFSAWGQWSPQSGCPPGGGPGRWNNTATDLITSSDFRCEDEQMRDLRVYSPDHRSSVHIVGDQWSVRVGKLTLSLKANESYVGYPAELGWAPDNKTFYITQIEGGLRTYRTEIYRVQESGIERLPGVAQNVHSDFDAKYGCVENVDGRPNRWPSNIAGFKWIDGSGQLVLIAAVPSAGICERSSYFEGYLVSIPDGKILARYTPKELKRRWGRSFGEALNYEYDAITEPDR